MPRKVLDARLLDHAISAGAEFAHLRVKALAPARGGVSVNGGQLTVRYVIGADGATSTVRRLLPVPAFDPAHVAVAVRGYTDGVPDDLDELFIRWLGGRAGRAYVWAFPTAGTANIGGGVFRQNSLRLNRQQLNAMVLDSLPEHWHPDPATIRGHLLPLTWVSGSRRWSCYWSCVPVFCVQLCGCPLGAVRWWGRGGVSQVVTPVGSGSVVCSVGCLVAVSGRRLRPGRCGPVRVWLVVRGVW